MRTNNLELPSANELRVMIKKESPRLAARRDYFQQYPELFDAITELAANHRVDMGVFKDYAAMTFDDVIASLHDFVNALEPAVDSESELTLRVYDKLSVSIDPEVSDCIFVLGSPADLRIAKAVELYKEGIAPKIIVTGARPHWGTSDSLAEADRTAAYAYEHSVPVGAVIVENNSIAVPDNVKRSVDLMERMNWRPEKVTIVTAGFNLRRAHMDMYKFPPWHMQIYTVAANGSEGINRNNWVGSERSRRIILNEYAKLIIESKIDDMLMKERMT